MKDSIFLVRKTVKQKGNTTLKSYVEKSKKSIPPFTGILRSAILRAEKEWRYGNVGQADLCWVLPAVRWQGGLCGLAGHRRRHRRGKCHLDHLSLRRCSQVLHLQQKSFCAFIEVNGERKAKYKRLLNMKISGEAIERLEEEGFRGPVRGWPVHSQVGRSPSTEPWQRGLSAKEILLCPGSSAERTR